MVYPNGIITIHIIDGEKSFSLVSDVPSVLTFLGRIEVRLLVLFPDPKDKVVSPVRRGY
jgi:hypothetical protein